MLKKNIEKIRKNWRKKIRIFLILSSGQKWTFTYYLLFVTWPRPCRLSIDPTLGSTFLYCLFSLRKMQHQILSFFKSRNPDWKDKTWYFCLIPIIVLHYGQFLEVLSKNSLLLKDTRNCFTTKNMHKVLPEFESWQIFALTSL